MGPTGGTVTGLTAHDDAYVIISGSGPLTPTFYGVLVNDASATPATASLLTSTGHGSLRFADNGTFTYTPDTGFAGVDSFRYQALAESLTSDATVTIYVVPVTTSAEGSTLNVLALTPEQQIATIFQAFYARGADATTFGEWLTYYKANPDGLSPADLYSYIAGKFAASPEAIAQYPLLANPQAATDADINAFVGVIYNNVFNRSPAPAEGGYWTTQIRLAIDNNVPIGTILLDFLNGAQNTGVGQDITTLLSKVAVSLEYVLQQVEHGASWTLAANGAQAVGLVAAVSDQQLTVLAGTANAALLVSPSSLTSADPPSDGGSSGGVSPLPGSIGPGAHDDAYVLFPGQSLAVGAGPGVLANDNLGSGSTARLLVGPEHGSLRLAADGSFTYEAAAGFSGVDTFSYRAVALDGSISEATASVYVTPTLAGGTLVDFGRLAPDQKIATLYLAYLGRAADAASFEDWKGQLAAATATKGSIGAIVDVANAFALGTEARTLYPFLANPLSTGAPGTPVTDARIADFLNDAYNNLFGRSADAEGLAYWTGQVDAALSSGGFVGTVLINMISGAQNSSAGQDITTLLSRVAVSLQYVKDQEQSGASWSLAANGPEAAALVASVTDDPLTVLAATAYAQTLADPASASPLAGLLPADPSLVSITSANVLDETGDTTNWQFLHDGSQTTIVQPTTEIARAFSLADGDRLDLTQILANAPLRSDLTNIGDFVKVLGYGANDAGYGDGTKTLLSVAGPDGSALVALEGSGRLTVDDLLRHDSLILPPR
ncbi:MAG: DUF4214 domain-containing protein [Reyranellaceae bacterium]